MSYVIEVRYDRYDAEAGSAESADGAMCVEHFQLSESIRDTHYKSLSVVRFENTTRAMKFADAVTPDAAMDRVVCDLDISIGDLGRDPGSDVFLVNPFEITQDQIPDVLDMWHKAKHHMIEHDGFVNARLFRSWRQWDRYGLVNVAQWSSAEAFKQALGDKAYDQHRIRSLSYRLHPSLCVKARSLEMA